MQTRSRFEQDVLENESCQQIDVDIADEIISCYLESERVGQEIERLLVAFADVAWFTCPEAVVFPREPPASLIWNEDEFRSKLMQTSMIRRITNCY